MDQPRLAVSEQYPAIEDHGLIGDGKGSALVARTGAVSFMCVPQFDSPPLFCPLLDYVHGGCFLVAPPDIQESHQYYVQDTAVLVTEVCTVTGTVELTDTFLLDAGALLEQDAAAGTGEFVRRARVLHGRTRMSVIIKPRGGARATREPDGWKLTCPLQQLDLHVRSSVPLQGAESELTLREGEELVLALSWRTAPPCRRSASYWDRRIDETVRVWRRWSAQIVDDVPHADLVRRSALTLKLLDHIENGAIVAAPTSSLPEHIGGNRNWDYRYAWVRDTAYGVFALRRIGLLAEAGRFLSWALTAIEREGPLVLYDIDGRPPPPEVIDEELEGYRATAPVRWGNAAAQQTQHDLYGEILDCAFQWAATGGRLHGRLWPRLADLADQARAVWQTPDHGIWEVRTAGRPFTYSAAMCQVALDRAARLARRLHLPGDPDTWNAEAQAITDHILRHAWDERAQSLTEHLGPGGALDASLLALPLRRVLPADHPRMIATTRAVTQRLGAGDGLLYRYLPQDSPDGLGQGEGAFVLCSFWLVDNLTGQGRVTEAEELFEQLCSYTNQLGLLAEQIDPTDHSFLGNFPQGLSHVGLISSAVSLARAHRGVRPELATHAWFD